MAEAARALGHDLAGVDPEAFARAVDVEAAGRLDAFVAGVRTYRASAFGRELEDPPEVWRRGSTRLLDYGAGRDDDGRAPILAVPSLINRAYILDLAPRRSLMRALAAAGFRPFLLDWGAPEGDERGFGLSDYVAGRGEAALAQVRELAGRPVAVLGYCMGGLLALALAQRRPEDVAALVLMATPWDFHAAAGPKAAVLRAAAPLIAAATANLGVLPVDVLQAMFASLSPYLAPTKFRRFAALDPRSARARLFVALEDWLNDGVPLAGPVARETLTGWYGDNLPAVGEWRIAGRAVLPAEVPAPSLVLIPEADHIVPPASATPLALTLPRACARTVAAGHIGMVAGGRAPAILYRPLARWLAGILDPV